MAIGTLFFMTVFLDLLTVGSNEDFILNIIARTIVFAFTVFTSTFILKSKSINNIIFSTMLFSIVTITCYQFILYLYSGQDFMQQGMAYLLIIYAIFLLPNRWIYAFCFSICIVVIFFFLSTVYIDGTSFNNLINVLVHLTSGIILGAMTSYSLSRSRRLQFVREKQLKILSTTDHLTGSYNRQKFDQFFMELLEITHTKNTNFSIIMFDLDNFKKFNDTYGHTIGDKILKSCASVTNANVRKQDILARWGGEEFIVLLPDTTLNEGTVLAERLRKCIESLRIENDIHITASFGVTNICDGDTMDTAVSRVDSYLYKAKYNGKSCVCAQ